MQERCIVCVDDEAIILENLKVELKRELPDVRIVTALNGERALERMRLLYAEGTEPAVLITDERMPKMPGHILLREAKKAYPELYGILLTAYMDFSIIAEAVNEAGLFRYIRKPWESKDLTMAVTQALKAFDRKKELTELRGEVQRLNLAMIAALEDNTQVLGEDVRHVQRVGCFAALIAKELGQDHSFIRKIYLYAPLHDIGKSGIPHDILAKPGSLSEDEFTMVKTHVSIGARILKSIDVDPIAKDLILYHHEQWDGNGYLAELRGTDIPLSARIVALADSLDAMMCSRPYKEAKSFEQAAEQIIKQSGIRFDPQLVDVFIKNKEEIKRIALADKPYPCIDMYLPR